MKRALVAVLFAVASTTCPSLDAPAAHAATMITFIDGPGRQLVGASADGRIVLTSTSAPFNVSYQIVDRMTGIVTPLANHGPPNALLASDGKKIAFMAGTDLVATDTDHAADIYTMTIATGEFELMTPGMPGWVFNGIGDVNADGSRVAVTGYDQSLQQSTSFIADGATIVRLGPTLSSQIRPPRSISADGNRVLYSADRPCTVPGGCAEHEQQLYVDDVTSLTDIHTTPVGHTVDGAYAFVGSTVLSADGNWILMRSFDGLFRGSASITNSMVLVGVINDPTSGDNDMKISISADGQKYTWLNQYPVVPAVGQPQTTQVFVHDGTTELAASVPSDQLPNNSAAGGMISDDGSVVLFTSLASNLAPGTTPGDNNYAHDLPIDPPPVIEPPSVDGSFFTARTPKRVVDTRSELGYHGAQPSPGTSIVVPIRGLDEVPSYASAVAVQLTTTGGTGAGYLSAVPTTGSAVPLVSNLNLDVPGETIANMAVVPIGQNGSITVYTSVATDVVVDLLGWWTPAGVPTRAGRYRAVGPNRVLDTRPSSPINSTGTKPGAGTTTLLQMAGRAGVPAAGVSAVVINLTVVDPTAPGFVQTAAGNNLQVGASSTLNVSAAGQTVAAAAIVPVDANGSIALYTQPSAHLVVDVSGWFTDGSAQPGGDGLFVPRDVPTRIVDTRAGLGFPVKPSAGTRFDVGSPDGALVGNLTVTENIGPGFAQLGPAATMTNGSTSNINTSTANETIANAFIIPIADGFGVFTSAGTHVILDVSGYMTAPP